MVQKCICNQTFPQRTVKGDLKGKKKQYNTEINQQEKQTVKIAQRKFSCCYIFFVSLFFFTLQYICCHGKNAILLIQVISSNKLFDSDPYFVIFLVPFYNLGCLFCNNNNNNTIVGSFNSWFVLRIFFFFFFKKKVKKTLHFLPPLCSFTGLSWSVLGCVMHQRAHFTSPL